MLKKNKYIYIISCLFLFSCIGTRDKGWVDTKAIKTKKLKKEIESTLKNLNIKDLFRNPTYYENTESLFFFPKNKTHIYLELFSLSNVEYPLYNKWEVEIANSQLKNIAKITKEQSFPEAVKITFLLDSSTIEQAKELEENLQLTLKIKLENSDLYPIYPIETEKTYKVDLTNFESYFEDKIKNLRASDFGLALPINNGSLFNPNLQHEILDEINRSNLEGKCLINESYKDQNSNTLTEYQIVNNKINQITSTLQITCNQVFQGIAEEIKIEEETTFSN